MIELGAIYPVAVDIFNEAGQLADPGTATLVITQPDQTQPSCPITLPSAVPGQLRYSFQTAQPGRHTVRLTTTSPVTVFGDVFDVNKASPDAIISLADCKQTLQMDPADTTDDAELLAKLQAVTASVQRYMHTQYVPVQLTEWHNLPSMSIPWERPRLRLGAGHSLTPAGSQAVPVLSLDSLVTYGTTGQVITTYDTAGSMYADAETGLVYVYNGPPLAGRIQAQWHAGYTVIPYNVIEGSKVLLQAVWESRRGPGGLGGVIGPEEMADYRHFTAMPRKVMDWLGPPRPVVF